MTDKVDDGVTEKVNPFQSVLDRAKEIKLPISKTPEGWTLIELSSDGSSEELPEHVAMGFGENIAEEDEPPKYDRQFSYDEKVVLLISDSFATYQIRRDAKAYPTPVGVIKQAGLSCYNVADLKAELQNAIKPTKRMLSLFN